MTFRDHLYTRLIDWNTESWVWSGGEELPNMNDAVLNSVSESRIDGLEIVAVVGQRPINTILKFEDPFFYEYIEPWLRERVGMRLKELYDEEIAYPPKY